MFIMGFLKLTVPGETGGGQKQMNCLSEVILAPDNRSDCLALWFGLGIIQGIQPLAIISLLTF